MKVQIANPVKNKWFKNTTTEKEKLILAHSDRTDNWQDKTVTQKLFCITDNLNGSHYHTNYLTYLELAWANHYGVVMTPDIMWYTLLSELVTIVKTSPVEYASLFTDMPDKKQTIIIDCSGELPLDAVIDSLKNLVPTSIDDFMPEFTTTTDRSRMARYASFADMVSPYYNYCVLMCGIPFVDVQGTLEDWLKVSSQWEVLSAYFPREKTYFNKVSQILKDVIQKKDNSKFWFDMFSMEKCGSGSQEEVRGWFSDLYKTVPSLKMTCNYSSHLAKVSYKNLNKNQDYVMFHGILSSDLKEDCLVPEFGRILYHKPEQPVVTKKEPMKIKTETIVYNALETV